ncbi:MAG: AmmeMemoRadiSam system radical SAM enzyme [Candidatus Omnitrophica bacterium]|nr:AmmeMemoRadiSam system radical SAM enzyme [Candidatus Omnitrophota bacterium]
MDASLNRRKFVQASVCAGCALSMGGTLLAAPGAQAADALPLTKELSDQEALYYDKLDDLKIQCKLCPKECRVADKERGYCGVRENKGGVYTTLVYGRPCTLHVDPIEKKPLFHYMPGTAAFSIATAGCNMECKFCQNWDISQFRPEQIRMIDLSPQKTADLAKETKSQTIAYTYSEPVIFYEYMYDAAKAARELGVGSVMISNGYIQEKPLRALCKQLTGVKIDFKAFTEKFYKETCSGELAPVLKALKIIREEGVWLELVVLIIPTLNDGEDENKSMAEWIVKNLGDQVPVHLTRYHPTYKLKITSTPVKTLEKLRSLMMKEGLKYVYLGNVAGHPSENTKCPECGAMLIRRLGFQTQIENLEDGECKKCHTKIPGVWSDPLVKISG